MATTDLGLESFGYGANMGNPMAFQRAISDDAAARQLAQQQKQYAFGAEQRADQAAPAALAAIAALYGNVAQDQAQGGTTQPQPPMPGQQSMPNMGTQPPIQPVQSAPIGAAPPPMGVPPTAQQIPQLSASALQPPSQGGMGPAIGRMDPPPPPMGQMQGQPQQNLASALTQQYPSMGALTGAIRQANPDLDGAALMNLMQRVQPLYQGKSVDPYRTLIEQQKLGMGAFAPDPEVIKSWAQQLEAGDNSVLVRQNPGVRALIRDQTIKDGYDGNKLVNAALGYRQQQNEISSTARRTGPLQLSSQEFNENYPDAMSLAEKTLSSDNNQLLAGADNWFLQFNNDPRFSALIQKTDNLVNAWARSEGGGIANVETIRQGEDAIGKTKTAEAYQAVITSMYNAIKKNETAGNKAMKHLTTARPAGNMKEDDGTNGVPGIQVEGGPTTGEDPFKGWGNPKVQ